jgi:phosphohistidine phosphatase
MKTILLMRHAKAEVGLPGQRDFDRPLAARGREDASRMGGVLAKNRAVPGAIVASPAARAKQTAEIAAQAMRFDGSIRLVAALYDAPGEAWLEALRALPASCESALVVAHSPGVAEAAALLCAASPGSFDVPTAGVLALHDPVDRWRDLEEGGAVLRWFARPKMIEPL